VAQIGLRGKAIQFDSSEWSCCPGSGRKGTLGEGRITRDEFYAVVMSAQIVVSAELFATLKDANKKQVKQVHKWLATGNSDRAFRHVSNC
jgi:hypothetical protein